jgi:hypothetical protein
MRQVLIRLGLVPRGGNYETVRRRMDQLGLPRDRFPRRVRGRHLLDCSPEEIAGAVSDARSLAQVLVALNIRPGGNQTRLKGRIAELGLDTSHFVGQAWRKGTRMPVRPATPLNEVLVEGRWTQTSTLKRRLIGSGLKRRVCERCLRSHWNDLPIPLELDHVNRRRDDNRLENLRILCPNCHAQTDTYRGRNIGLKAPV